jgi:molybdate transport system substrate-binding protein
MTRKYLLGLLLTACTLPSFAFGQTKATLSLAAASDLIYCLEELNAEFQKAHSNIALKTSIGSSGNFFAQIQNGAPFDLFLSADVKYPQALIKAGLADSSSLTLYAIGRIVLWTIKPDLNVARGLEILRDARVKKLALANPAHAPYGRAAQAALEHHKMWNALQQKIVLGENIAQTVQFVETGNVDAGIVALALVLSPKLKNTGKYFEIPEASYPLMEQAAVLTNKGKNNPAAQAYLQFLRSDKARGIFDRYGFRLPK